VEKDWAMGAPSATSSRSPIAFVVTEAVVLIEGIFYGGRNFETALRDLDREK
jgi:hypothetical protein